LGGKLGSIGGDPLPDEQNMTQFLADVLSKQGYRGARAGIDEPTLYLVVQWGYLSPQTGDLLWFLGYDRNKDIGAPTFPGMLGPEIYRRGFRSRTTETILDNASTPIYGIIVTAFEYQSAATPHPIIYWQTRIGLPANGKSMIEALPTMLLAAGSAIGRESESPLLRDADHARKGRVDFGELKAIGFSDEPTSSRRASPSNGKN
jgi:hypothetical protein